MALAYYYFRPQTGLGGATPAEASHNLEPLISTRSSLPEGIEEIL
jgi:hypothetical protein